MGKPVEKPEVQTIGGCLMIFSGCQGKPRTPTIAEKICPQCGSTIEVFSTDTQVACEHCGFVVYNDTLSCVQWCKYAKQCVGEEMYNHMMEIAAAQKQRTQESKTGGAPHDPENH